MKNRYGVTPKFVVVNEKDLGIIGMSDSLVVKVSPSYKKNGKKRAYHTWSAAENKRLLALKKKNIKCGTIAKMMNKTLNQVHGQISNLRK